MAEAPRYSNVIKTTTDADAITGALRVIGIKLVGGSSGATWNLKNAGGTIIYSITVGNNSESYNQFDDGWQLRSEVYAGNFSAGSGTAYIYFK